MPAGFDELHCPVSQYDGVTAEGLPDMMKMHQMLSDGLQWAAARMGLITQCFEVQTGLLFNKGLLSWPLNCALLSSKAQLSNVRCLSFQAETEYLAYDATAQLQAFQEWVLKQVPQIEALRLLRTAPRLAGCATTLQQLKHLELEAHAFFGGSSQLQAAKQLPCLETLYLHARDRDSDREAIDVLECQHLRRLVVIGTYAYLQAVLCEPKCHLGIHVPNYHLRLAKLRNDSAMQKTFAATESLVLHDVGAYQSNCFRHDSSLCQPFGSMETLTLNWPVNQMVSGDPNPDFAVEKAEGLLRCHMPANGQPLISLKALIIVGKGAMTCRIPSWGLPSLEELVLFAEGTAEVSFDDPSGTLSSLETLYIFGQPLIDMHGCDLSPIEADLAKRGLMLSTISIKRAGKGFKRRSSCMYLRPETAPELSLRELYNRASRLARECRCSTLR